jgi:DNA gyrase/topoisomerase IV subunit A
VLGLPAPERFPTMLPVSSFADEGTSLVMATSAGGIKRTPLAAFSNIMRNGLAAIKLSEVRTCSDQMRAVQVPNDSLLVFSKCYVLQSAAAPRLARAVDVLCSTAQRE